MRMKRDDWDAVMATNLTATFTLAQAAMRPMLKQRGGRIIAVSSVVGQMGNAGQTNYAASKAGLDRVRQGAGARGRVARHHGERRSRPGMIETDMTRAIDREGAGRLGGADSARPPRHASTMWPPRSCFLASDEAAYITGHVLAVNGGMYM